MMTPFLQQRFEQLLRFAKDTAHNLTAYENIAAAREMVDTVHICGLLTSEEHNEYRALVTTARLVVSAAELKRADDALQMAVNQWDGVRDSVSDYLVKPA